MSLDIVIPLYGQADHLKRCLFSLSQQDGHRVYLVDDATPPERGEGLAEIYEHLPDFVNLTVSPENHGFAETCNIGVGLGQADYVCLMNSDIEIQPETLPALTNVLDKYPQVGVVGARLIFPPWSHEPARPAGRTQHAGVVFNIERMPYHIFLGWQPDHPRVNRSRFMQAVTGALIVTRREIYEQLDGLELKYTIGNFEDIAYCLRAKQLGYQTYYEAQALAWHYGGGSNNSATAEKNAQIFLTDWQATTEYDEWRYY